MFAPPVAKSKAKTPTSSNDKSALHRATPFGHRQTDAGVEQAHLLRLEAFPGAGIVQRKSACACGGGCPRCQDASSKLKIGESDDPPGRMSGDHPPSPFPAPRLPGPLQAKLKVGAVNDPLEQEADSVAEQVMRMPAPGVPLTFAPPQVSRKCAECEEEEVKIQKNRRGRPKPPPAKRQPSFTRCCARLGSLWTNLRGPISSRGLGMISVACGFTPMRSPSDRRGM